MNEFCCISHLTSLYIGNLTPAFCYTGCLTHSLCYSGYLTPLYHYTGYFSMCYNGYLTTLYCNTGYLTSYLCWFSFTSFLALLASSSSLRIMKCCGGQLNLITVFMDLLHIKRYIKFLLPSSSNSPNGGLPLCFVFSQKECFLR